MARPKEHQLISDVKTGNWYHLGLVLTNDEKGMGLIKRNNHNNAEGALEATFALWLKRNDCTWWGMVDALREINEMRLAAELQQKYCQ